MLKVVAKLDRDVSAALDCYTVVVGDGHCDSIDFWFLEGERPTSMDLHVVFERGEEPK